MTIDFTKIEIRTFTAHHGGAGDLVALVHSGEFGSVMPCRLQPGASVGPHGHEGMEIMYVLYGFGTAVCDGVEEPLFTDVCHVCPPGSEHSIVNTGEVELVMLAVTVNKEAL
jgi:mannose-6-phosphate isomerase-like protein (cupin superfamily)